MPSDTNEIYTRRYAEVLSTCVCLNLRKASRSVTQLFEESLRPSGVKATQLPVLVTLALKDSMTVTGLANGLVMDRTSLARLLSPLVTSGLVEIEAGEDRRTREISLTDEGRRRAAQAVPMWEKAQSHVTRELGETRWTHLRQSLAAALLIRGLD